MRYADMSTLASARLRVTGDFEAVFAVMYSRGVTDGLPVIPPTEAAVRAMLGTHEPDTLIAMLFDGDGILEAFSEFRKTAGKFDNLNR